MDHRVIEIHSFQRETLGFVFGGIGLGIYFRSLVDFLFLWRPDGLVTGSQ